MEHCRARALPPMLLLALSAPLLQLSAATTDVAQVTPVQKVIVLLSGMLEKGKKEKHEEQVQFAAYKQFCDDTTVEKQRLITSAGEKIDMLKAEIQKHIADSERLGKEIASLDTDVAAWSGDEKAAGKVREIEKADYAALHKDYSESVDALQRAIAVLKQQAAKQASLAQVSALKGLNLIPQEAKKAIDLFLAQQESVEDPDSLPGPPEAATYEFQSHGIIEILEKLLDKFVEEKTNAEKAEMNAQHAFEMLMQDLRAQIKQAKEDSTQKSSAKAKMLQAKADAEGDLTDTTGTLAADKKYLSDLTASCQTKAADFSDRQKLRAEELQALEKAVAILSEKVSGAADKYLPTLLQHKDGRKSLPTMAQLSNNDHRPAQERVADYLRAQARQLNSRVLSALAVKVAEDPFGKVKKLIKDLIVRLMSEANEEAEHKGWCDVELSTNEQTRQEKTQTVEILHAEIDELQASVAQLGEEIVAGTQAAADLDSAMADATKIRQKEKAENEAAIADARDAQAAVAQAVVVLEEFYAKAGDATALVQKKKQKQEPPAIFDSPYQGMQSEKGGVIGMLEVIQADFARLETDTSSAEASAQKDYDEFMTDSKVDKAQKQKDIEYKSAKKQESEQSLTTKNSDLQGTQRELDAALSYYDKLRPSCVDAGSSYDDRVTRRKEEIESLQEALRILNGEDIA